MLSKSPARTKALAENAYDIVCKIRFIKKPPSPFDIGASGFSVGVKDGKIVFEKEASDERHRTVSPFAGATKTMVCG
jgi:hypothetical protein